MRKNHSKIVCIKLVHLPYLEHCALAYCFCIYALYQKVLTKILVYNILIIGIIMNDEW